jgi:hypothetical protein
MFTGPSALYSPERVSRADGLGQAPARHRTVTAVDVRGCQARRWSNS